MVDRDRALQVGTALLVVGRLLLDPPGPRTAEMFSSPQFLSTWPLGSGSAVDALLHLGRFDQDAAVREFQRLCAPGGSIDMQESTRGGDGAAASVWEELLDGSTYPQMGLRTSVPPDHLGHEITWLAEETLALAGGPSPASPHGDRARRSAVLRDDHILPLARAVSADLCAQARVEPYVVLPLLLEEALSTHADLLPNAAPESVCTSGSGSTLA